MKDDASFSFQMLPVNFEQRKPRGQCHVADLLVTP
jgi:hypothetical protein